MRWRCWFSCRINTIRLEYYELWIETLELFKYNKSFTQNKNKKWVDSFLYAEMELWKRVKVMDTAKLAYEIVP